MAATDAGVLRLVLISDTHNMHRQLQVPDGDVLIHAGDFTLYGRGSHAADFNLWLGELPHPHKIVVLGNHECNMDWAETSRSLSSVITNAVCLVDSGTTVLRPSDSGKAGSGNSDNPPPLKIWGTNFFWPFPDGEPNYNLIPLDTDIVVAHGPAAGFVDGGSGCPALARRVSELPSVKLVVSGHIHVAHGTAKGAGADGSGTFVNAAVAGQHAKLEYPAIVVDM